MQELKLREIPSKKKVRFGFYLYTYARTVVMRSLLFRKDDYNKMLKMAFDEIAKFLQESHYRKEINEFATQYSGTDLLELSLNRNLAASFKKLMKISPHELGLLISEYAKRKDIEDLKTIIRGQFTKTDDKAVLASITGAGTLDYGFLVSLSRKDSIEEILRNNGLVGFVLFKDALKELSEKNSIAAIENVLDKFYYTKLMQFSETLPKQGRLFRNFILKEIEILNLLTLLRLKKAKLPKDSINDFIIPSSPITAKSKIQYILGVEDIDQISKILEAEYGNVVSHGIEEFKKTNSLIALEIGLYRHLLRQSILFMHQNPLSVDVILGYMFAKDIEIRNLRIIIKGKQLGLGEQFIESQLILE